VLQVTALGVSLINVLQRQFVTALTEHQQPEWPLESGLTVFVQQHNAHQGKGVLVHTQAVGLVFAAHEHVVPSPAVYGVVLAPPTDKGAFHRVIRGMPGIRVSQAESRTVVPWRPARCGCAALVGSGQVVSDARAWRRSRLYSVINHLSTM